ncbi:MAG: DUF4160 domain-containing protein [Isosphaeraceae bacterium]
MPRISLFYGIAIYMYYRDHSPPHVHAIYGEHEAIIEIGTGAILEGSLPRRALSMACDWVAMHRKELDANWQFARAGQPLNQIAPLD